MSPSKSSTPTPYRKLIVKSSLAYNNPIVKKKTPSKSISNRRARYDYELGEPLVVGMVLTGLETKALRMGHGHLRGAYVTLKDDELWLFNGTITGTPTMRIAETEQTRTRKLLAKRREIEALQRAKDQGLTIIPLEILNRGRYIKLRIAPARGKRKYDKRQVIKQREQQRNIQRAID